MKSFLIAVFILFGIFAMGNALIAIPQTKSVIHQMYISISIMIGLLSWILAAILNIDLNVEIKNAEE
uniref:Uncharacterized protein n=1 Tax=viral metagenome TaxID=1070528 RepID=A0A6M3JIL0_9ZZZZ